MLEPFCGTGSTLVGAARSGRNAVGIELNPKYAAIAQNMVADAISSLGIDGLEMEEFEAEQIVLLGDSSDQQILSCFDLGQFDYLFTSPPYWDMLHRVGPHQNRRIKRGLDQVYSDDERDLGNIHDYRLFVDCIGSLFAGLDQYLKPGAYATVVLQNTNREGRMYPLAWDCANAIADMTG